MAVALPARTMTNLSFIGNRWTWILGVLGGIVIFGSVVGLVVSAMPLDLLLMHRPYPADLVGTYHLTDASRRFLMRDKGYPSVPDSMIVVRPDLTVSIVNLPDCAVSGFGESAGRFLSGEGSWEIGKASPGYALTVDIKEGGSLGPGLYGNLLVIRRISPPHRLEWIVGDPDSSEALTYLRKEY
jgi:hypothetical protein